MIPAYVLQRDFSVQYCEVVVIILILEKRKQSQRAKTDLLLITVSERGCQLTFLLLPNNTLPISTCYLSITSEKKNLDKIRGHG